MRCFYFQRLLPNGQLKTGITKLAFLNELSAKIYMEKRWQSVIVKLVMLPGWFSIFYDWFVNIVHRPIQRYELADFFRNLAVMQGSGIPILEAMDEMSSEDSSLQTRHLAADILESLRSGATLSDSLERQADLIPETVRHLTQIGEVSGTLDRTLLDASEHLQRINKIVGDSKRAMIYPAFVFLSIFGTGLFWIGYVVPAISSLFKQMRVKLPPLTQWVLKMSNIAGSHFAWFVALLIALILGAVILVRRNAKVRYKVQELALALPVSRILVSSSALAFITEYLSLLISSGLNVVESLEVLRKATRNEVYKKAIGRIREGVMRGNSLSAGMRESRRFPGFVTRMVSVGEQAGSLDQQLKYLANEYRQRFDRVVGSIGEIIKPVVMLIAGALFIFMVVALFLPIYQLIGQVSAIH